MKPFDRVAEYSVTSGIGTLTLAGPITGYQSFSSVLANNQLCDYCIYDPVTFDWEVGIGTYISSNQLARTRVIGSSSSNGPVTFASNNKQVFIQFGSNEFKNDFGNGSDGSVTISSNTNWENNTAADDTGYVLKQFTSLTINSGQTVSANHRSQIMVVKVSGNCTINGTLTMTGKAANSTPISDQLYKLFQLNLINEIIRLDPKIPLVAAAGGAGGITGFNSNGSNGSDGMTGGGGGGAGGDSGTVSHLGLGGNGSFGSCFGGGSGGGAGSNTAVPHDATAGGNYSGAGGNAGIGPAGSSGGNGSPNGSNSSPGANITFGSPSGGPGGVILLMVGGNLTVGGSGIISCNGGSSASVNDSGGTVRAATGGASGGGCIIIGYAGSLTLTAGYSITANGGIAGLATGGFSNNNGGNGGNGSIYGPVKLAG